MGTRVLICVILVSLWPAPAAARIVLDFRQCVERVLKHNEEIKAAQMEIKVSEAKAIEAHPRGIPVFKYEYRTAPVPRNIDDIEGSILDGDISILNAFKVEFGTPVTTFGKIATAQDLAGIGINAAHLKKQKKADEIVLQVYKLYEGILLARELLSLGAQAEDALTDKIRALEKERILDQIQILKLKVALYEVERRVEEARRKEKLAVHALKVQMGMDTAVDFDIKSLSLRPVHFTRRGAEYFIAHSKTYNPDYALLKAGIKALEKKLKIEKLAYAPNLGVGGFFDVGRTPGVIGADDENTFTNPFNFTKGGVGFQLKGEFDFVKTRSKIRQADYALLKTLHQRRAAMGGLELDVRKAYLEVVEAQSLRERAAAEKRAARQMVFLTKSNLDIGIGDKKDYLDALQSYLLFQGREFEAIYNFNVAVAALKIRIGEFYSEQRRHDS